MRLYAVQQRPECLAERTEGEFGTQSPAPWRGQSLIHLLGVDAWSRLGTRLNLCLRCCSFFTRDSTVELRSMTPVDIARHTLAWTMP